MYAKEEKKNLKKPHTTISREKNSSNNTTITKQQKHTTSRDVQQRVSPKCLCPANVHRGEGKTRLDIKLWDINMTGKRQHQIAGPKSNQPLC